MVKKDKWNGTERFLWDLEGILVLQVLKENLRVKKEERGVNRCLFETEGLRSSITQDERSKRR